LSEGVVEPALNAVNIHDAGALSAAIRATLDSLSPRPRRIALVLPDTVAKVSLIRFEKVPSKVQDLDQLVRWQLRKAAPFKIEEAQVAWVPGVALEGGGREYVVSAARRDLIAAYEQACEAAGAHAGVVDLASFNLMNTVLATMPSVPGDWLLVHVGAEYATLAVVRGPDLVFFRNRGAAGPAELADLVHQTAMYHEDRLGGGGFSRVVMAGAALQGPEKAEWIRRSLEERLQARIDTLDFRGAVAIQDRIMVGPELLDALAPGLGVLLRERAA
jgi:type IV pilus assembly protein PilM